MEHLSATVVEGRVNVATHVLPFVKEANSSLHGTVDSSTTIGTVSKRKLNLTDEERRAVYDSLLLKVKNPRKPDKLVKGALDDVAKRFCVTRDMVSAVWKRGRQSLAGGAISANVSSLKRGHVGRKKKVLDVNQLKEIPLVHRKNIRSVAAKMNMSAATIHRRVKEGEIKRHSNAIKPFLTDVNKVDRVRFCLSMLDSEKSPMFQDCMNMVHIDEKWFYITETNAKFYLTPDEEPPLRTAKSKRFISKVMFLAAVARPRHDSYRNRKFDGKIGIFPFVFQESAKRSSKNRPHGTLEVKCIERVTKEEVMVMLIDKVLPAIREKWPRSWPGKTSGTIVIQQDNAKPHPNGTETDLAAALTKDGFNIVMTSQPPNSPDMNVLDLGLFRAIQALQYQLTQKNFECLIAATEQAFWMMDPKKLNNIFLTWQTCMIQVMSIDGGIHYQIPHLGKSSLQHKGELPENVKCPGDIIEHAKQFISVNG